MRRSKSNPARYAKNYRSISQRRMTGHTADEDLAEEERLTRVVRESKAQIEKGEDCQKKRQESTLNSHKRKRSVECPRAEGKEKGDDAPSNETAIFSKEMLEELGEDAAAEAEAILMAAAGGSKKKKTKSTRKEVQLTPAELKQARQLYKSANRKLQQLQDRAIKKKRRAELYDNLRQTALSTNDLELLSSSSRLGIKKLSKREELKYLLQKERAGVALTKEEKDLLYQERGDGNGEIPVTLPGAMETTQVREKATATTPGQESMTSTDASREKCTKSSKRKDKKKIKNTQKGDETKVRIAEESDLPSKRDPSKGSNSQPNESVSSSLQKQNKDGNAEEGETTPPSAASFAAQMMASLTQLKATSVEQSEKTTRAKEEAEMKALELEEARQKPTKRYIPSDPIELKTAATLGIHASSPLKHTKKVCKVSRPADVKAIRLELPVATMEFEVMDAIRNNDVTILCAETGSGKSTQVPQFVYEAGMSLAPQISGGTDGEVSPADSQNVLLIGVTQPRRVAAVSTAKRVSYEMGHGNGRTIANNNNGSDGLGRGNLVAYQTRYESAGLGSSTCIKFMTDGILLQEIQSDLLLRRYSVIILDEAHERNLNTDVLIGLLSVALPLRQKAAEEIGSKIPPLRIIIMSATLRVEDFVGNKKLFPGMRSAVVKVPGRTHPVTIHHSRTTELDNYEDAVFSKTCKIHRKLPAGGILVFLTGKQEIVRMVKRLRNALEPSTNGSRVTDEFGLDVEVCSGDLTSSGPRDMDDDEVDGDAFDGDQEDNFDEDMKGNVEANVDKGESEGPSKVLVLPLYSLMSTEEQAKVFAFVPEDTRLIVVATNIAETSITIPGVVYVVDSGRQKCRNYSAGTGVASYDIMWISKAAAGQRAGRAGRTGPGHCYRVYSSSMFSRHMDAFALPEVLSRPLEDVVLAMKAMRVSNVANFPFPTPPDQSQVDAAVKLLANLGCLDLSDAEENGRDGAITALGDAVAKLPLGVRYGKMLLVAAQAGVLDYAIVIVAVLSESSPFIFTPFGVSEEDKKECDALDKEENEDSSKRPQKPRRWAHKAGDVHASMLAVGGYTYAGRGAGGVTQKVACKNFCLENWLDPVVMARIQKLRTHLARLAKSRLGTASGVAAKTGGILSSMKPPNKLQEQLLSQSIASGLIDQVAMLAPLGSIPGQHPFSLRSAYLSCASTTREPIFLDRNSVLYSRDSRLLPQWVCYDSMTRKKLKDGTNVSIMKNITPIEASWLGQVAKGTNLIKLGEPLRTPPAVYDTELDAVMASVLTKFGAHGWEIPPVKIPMFDALQTPAARRSPHFSSDDSFRYFARFLLEGKVIRELEGLSAYLNDSPLIITRNLPSAKVSMLVSALAEAGIDSATALRKHWSEENDKFLFGILKRWVREEHAADAKKMWITAVKRNTNGR